MQNLVNRRFVMKGTAGALIAVSASSWTKLAFAQSSTLRVAIVDTIASFDPTYSNSGASSAIAAYFFDTLVMRDPRANSIPGLAESWRNLDDNTWEFTLRQGVTFHDGSPFTADDVLATFERVNASTDVNSKIVYTKTIKKISKTDDGKILIETNAPDPTLDASLCKLPIISAKYKDAPASDFSSGKAIIGTGPFKFTDYADSRLTCAANPDYWGAKAAWQTAIVRTIPDSAARLAALLSGDVDLIESPPFEGLPRIESNAGLQVLKDAGGRIATLHMDQFRDSSPFIRDNNGQPLNKNPFKDVRVRRALSMVIDRKAIVDRVMSGYAVEGSQFFESGGFGSAPEIKPGPADVEGAKALLAEAGYPDGFQLTIHAPTDRDINTPDITQAIAQMFTRVNVTTRVETMPYAVFVPKIDNAEFSCSINSWGITTEISVPMNMWLVTHDPKSGLGPKNSGRYSNPEFDRLLKSATTTVDREVRGKLLSDASRLAVKDMAVIFIHHETVVLGAIKSIDYAPRIDQYVLAALVEPKA